MPRASSPCSATPASPRQARDRRGRTRLVAGYRHRRRCASPPPRRGTSLRARLGTATAPVGRLHDRHGRRPPAVRRRFRRAARTGADDPRPHLGPPALALLPIGAYEPRWFMSAVHMNPEEAVEAHLALGATRSRWGCISAHSTSPTKPSKRRCTPSMPPASRRPRPHAKADFDTHGFGETRLYGLPWGLDGQPAIAALLCRPVQAGSNSHAESHLGQRLPVRLRPRRSWPPTPSSPAPSLTAAGGRFLARGTPSKTYEAGPDAAHRGHRVRQRGSRHGRS